MQAARRRRSYRKDAVLFELVTRYRKDNRHRDIAPLFIVHAGPWDSGNGRQRPCLSAAIDKCRNLDRGWSIGIPWRDPCAPHDEGRVVGSPFPSFRKMPEGENHIYTIIFGIISFYLT